MSAVGFEPTTKSLKDSCAAAAPRAQLGSIVLITAQFSSANYKPNNFHTIGSSYVKNLLCRPLILRLGDAVVLVATTNWGALSE